MYFSNSPFPNPLNLKPPTVQDQIKLKKLNQIISHLQNNKNYTIVYSNTEWSERSGKTIYFNKDDIPLKYADDQMITVSEVGVVLSDLDLGIYDIEIIRKLGNAVSSNKTIQSLIIQDDETITNGHFENIQELSQAIEVIFNSICSFTSLILHNNNLGSATLKT